MSLWQKLNSLMKASAQDPLQQLVDVNSLRIFEQEIRDAETAITRAKRELACVIAERKRIFRHNESLIEAITTRAAQALAAMEKQQDQLALDVAERIAEDEVLLKQQQEQLKALVQQEAYLRKQLREAARAIARYRSELRMAQANRNANTAVAQLRGYSQGLHSRITAMDESVEKIKSRNEAFMDFDHALQEVEAECSGGQLDEQLHAAGIKNHPYDGQLVLDRLRERLGDRCLD